MSDYRELIQMAAKAIGYQVIDWYGDKFPTHDGEKLIGWNPLSDDGDSRRLQIALGMNLYITNKYALAELISDSEEPAITRKEYCTEETKGAAARKAVVRVAAEIGRQMK